MSRLLAEKEKIEKRILQRYPEAARKILYHGNRISERLTELKPSFSRTQHHHLRGEFVFATTGFQNAALYSLKPDARLERSQRGYIQHVGEFMGNQASAYSGLSTMYAMIGDYDGLEETYEGGHIYFLDPQAFRTVDDYGGELVAQQKVQTDDAIRVDNPRDVMEAGVQLFAFSSPEAAQSIQDEWHGIREKGLEERALREYLIPNRDLIWVNKEYDIPIPNGPMCDW